MYISRRNESEQSGYVYVCNCIMFPLCAAQCNVFNQMQCFQCFQCCSMFSYPDNK